MRILLSFYYFRNFSIHSVSCRFNFTLITQHIVSCFICSKINTFNDGHSIRHEFVAYMRISIVRCESFLQGRILSSVPCLLCLISVPLQVLCPIYPVESRK